LIPNKAHILVAFLQSCNKRFVPNETCRVKMERLQNYRFRSTRRERNKND